MIYCCLVSTPVTDLTLTGVDDNTLEVTWGPPEMPNGYISSYDIIIENNVTTTGRDEEESTVSSTTFGGLCK